MGFFAERFRELDVVCGPGARVPTNDQTRSTLIWKRPFSRISVTANRSRGEARIVLIAEELSKTAVALDLDNGPHTVENGKLRAEYDGQRLRIQKKGRLSFTKSIDPSSW
jgi:hypothetical protein